MALQIMGEESEKESSDTQIILFKNNCLQKFINEVVRIYPGKAFGYFLSSRPFGDPEEFFMFKQNIRDEYDDLFEKYGNYYVTNKAGFVSTVEETIALERYIRKNGLFKVGVYHSHQRHPALLSSIDADLHPDEQLWHLIISLRNLEIPRVKIFSVKDDEISERRFL